MVPHTSNPTEGKTERTALQTDGFEDFPGKSLSRATLLVETREIDPDKLILLLESPDGYEYRFERFDQPSERFTFARRTNPDGEESTTAGNLPDVTDAYLSNLAGNDPRRLAVEQEDAPAERVTIDPAEVATDGGRTTWQYGENAAARADGGRERLTVTLREKRPDSPLGRPCIEIDPGEHGTICDVCGSWGITDASQSRVRNARNDPGRYVACESCAEQEDADEIVTDGGRRLNVDADADELRASASRELEHAVDAAASGDRAEVAEHVDAADDLLRQADERERDHDREVATDGGTVVDGLIEVYKGPTVAEFENHAAEVGLNGHCEECGTLTNNTTEDGRTLCRPCEIAEERAE